VTWMGDWLVQCYCKRETWVNDWLWACQRHGVCVLDHALALINFTCLQIRYSSDQLCQKVLLVPCYRVLCIRSAFSSSSTFVATA
jgi:hypothetical protein